LIYWPHYWIAFTHWYNTHFRHIIANNKPLLLPLGHWPLHITTAITFLPLQLLFSLSLIDITSLNITDITCRAAIHCYTHCHYYCHLLRYWWYYFRYFHYIFIRSLIIFHRYIFDYLPLFIFHIDIITHYCFSFIDIVCHIISWSLLHIIAAIDRILQLYYSQMMLHWYANIGRHCHTPRFHWLRHWLPDYMPQYFIDNIECHIIRLPLPPLTYCHFMPADLYFHMADSHLLVIIYATFIFIIATLFQLIFFFLSFHINIITLLSLLILLLILVTISPLMLYAILRFLSLAMPFRHYIFHYTLHADYFH